MYAGQLLTDSLDEQRGHYAGIHTAGQGQQHLAVSYLAADQFHLIGDEVFHIPVGLGTADAEHPFRQLGAARFLHGGETRLALMIQQHHRHRQIVHIGGHVNLHTVHHTVGAAVQDHALYIGQCFQFFPADVMGMDLAVHAQGADLAGQAGIFLAAQVQDYDHILFHIVPPVSILPAPQHTGRSYSFIIAHPAQAFQYAGKSLAPPAKPDIMKVHDPFRAA